MKRLFVLSLVGILSVGLLSLGAFAQVNTTGEDEMSDSTIVYWTYSGVVQCQVNLNVHGNVNLGEIETVDTTMTSNTATVTTESNCPYELTVNAIGASTPSGIANNNMIDDFALQLANWSGSISSADLTSWDSWGQVNGSEKLVGSWDGNETGDMSSASWDMRYRYTTDPQDVNGDYSVELQYTVSNT